MAAPPGPEVQEMFAEIAPQYDFLNRVLSFGIDRRWRRHAVRRLAPLPGEHFLDLCCGTGDLTLALAASGASLTGLDFAGPMLPLARNKAARLGRSVSWVRGDAQCLPFPDHSFDGITVAFGIRNVEDPRQALGECARVLRPGGRLAVLEFFPIRNRLWRRLFETYFHHVLPRIARLTRAGRTGAYAYLPASVQSFASPSEFGTWMVAAGFQEVEDEGLTGGVARLLLGRLPSTAEALRE